MKITEKKEKEKPYTKLANKLAKELKPADLYRFFCLASTPRKANNTETDTTFEQLADKTKESVYTVRDFAHRLIKSGLIPVNERNTPTERRWVYTIEDPLKDYKMIGCEFIKMELSTELNEASLKGFLLQLFSITLNNSTVTHYTMADMTKKDKNKVSMINMSRNTASKYLNELIRLGLVSKLKKGYKIKCEYFYEPDVSEIVEIMKLNSVYKDKIEKTNWDEVVDKRQYLLSIEADTPFTDKHRIKNDLTIIL